MKSLLWIPIVSLFFAGCGFKVVVSNDPFKKATVVTADMWHKVIDSKIDNQRVIYQKEIVNGKISKPTVSFEFSAAIGDMVGYHYHGEPLGNDVYVLCDANNFKVKLLDNNIITSTHFGRQENTDSKGNVNTVVNIGHSGYLSGKIILTQDIQQAILNCANYQIRFTVGNNYITLNATSSQLKAVKEFLLTNKAVN